MDTTDQFIFVKGGQTYFAKKVLALEEPMVATLSSSMVSVFTTRPPLTNAISRKGRYPLVEMPLYYQRTSFSVTYLRGLDRKEMSLFRCTKSLMKMKCRGDLSFTAPLCREGCLRTLRLGTCKAPRLVLCLGEWVSRAGHGQDTT